MGAARCLEIACFSVESAIVAHKAGASRIELCADPAVGGVTPSLADLRAVRSAVNDTPIHVMVRPRAGGFVYDDAELKQMRLDMCNMAPWADGFVFGILLEHDGIANNEHQKAAVNMDSCASLLHVTKHDQSQSLTPNCTFHRAFDEVGDWRQGLRDLSSCGFNAVLVSGHKDAKAIDWTARLKHMVEFSQAENLNVDVIVGGSVRSSNLQRLVTETGATWYHSSALVDDSSIASFDEIVQMKSILNTT